MYYYAWKPINSPYFRGHNILEASQIDSLMEHNIDAEHFGSVQQYDTDGIVIGSPLVFDIDFEGELGKAHAVARKVCSVLDEHATPYAAYFSGGKGFHIVVPKMIGGANAHTVAKAIKRTYFNFDGVDESIYRSKGLWRMEGSINKKSGLYKTEVDISWSLEYILEQAKTASIVQYKFPFDDSINLDEMIQMAEPLIEQLKVRERDDNANEDYYPSLCIRKMWADCDPPRDKWHEIIYTLVKHFYNLGYDSYEVVDAFDEHEFWGSLSGYGYSRRSYTKIIHSLARSTKLGMGCNSGLSADCMRHYCTPLCHYAGELTLSDLIWDKER